MDQDHHRAFIHPGGLHVIRQRNSTPTDIGDLSIHNSKMTWVCSTMNEILAARINLSENPVVVCDERTLSLSPHRQSRATWCTRDLHALLICIYDRYGPGRMKFEGPDRNGLSWIQFYKKTDFGAAHGRTKQLVHVSWVKPGDALARRIYEKVHSVGDGIPKEKRLLDPDTSTDSMRAGQRFASAMEALRSPFLFDAVDTADLNPRRLAPRIPAIKIEAPSVAASRTSGYPNPQTDKRHAVELAAPTSAFHSPDTKLETPAYSSVRGTCTKAEIHTEKHYSAPGMFIDWSTSVQTSSKSKDIYLMKASPEKPAAEAADEEWGIVSSVSMEGMDGDWTLVLDEDLC